MDKFALLALMDVLNVFLLKFVRPVIIIILFTTIYVLLYALKALGQILINVNYALHVVIVIHKDA